MFKKGRLKCMLSILLNGVLYVNCSLEIRKNDKYIDIYNSGILLKRVTYASAAAATSAFNSIVSGIESGSAFLNIDSIS